MNNIGKEQSLQTERPGVPLTANHILQQQQRYNCCERTLAVTQNNITTSTGGSVTAPTTASWVTLQRRKPVVWRLAARLLLLLLSHPRLRRIPTNHLLRLQLQLLELLVWVVVLLSLRRHTSIPSRLLYYIPTDSTSAAYRCTILLLLPLGPHTIVERPSAPASHHRRPPASCSISCCCRWCTGAVRPD
jgi:hypothetical protein